MRRQPVDQPPLPRPAIEVETLRLARHRLADWRAGECEVSEVRLDGGHPETRLVVVFTHRRRPGCTFGYRWALKVEANSPEAAVDNCVVNLDEQIDAVDYGLPADCRAGEVTWL